MIFIISFISSFEIIKDVVPERGFLFFVLIPASIAEAAAVVHNSAKICFVKRAATFINVPVNILNNDAKNPPDWII